jgi:hypothetical protein
LALLAAFVAGRVLPQDSIFLAFLVAAFTVYFLIDFFLFVTTGKDLKKHLKNEQI